MKRVAIVGALAFLLLTAGCAGSHRCSGSELIFRAVSTHGQPITPQGMQTAQQIMQSRLDRIGFSPTVAIKDGDEIVIDGLRDRAAAAKLVSVTGRLEMFDFEPS